MTELRMSMFSKSLNNLYRRKGLIVSVFVVVSLLALYLATTLPESIVKHAHCCYAPENPTAFVASTVTIDLNETMQSIVQEILSRIV